MRFRKEVLCELPFCYAAGAVTVDGAVKLLFAPDAPGPCYAVDPATGARETVWEGPGGTMSFVPLPDAEGDFLAVQRFFPDYEAADARIVRVRREAAAWRVEPWLALPYVHRFDILSRGGRRYLVCATLCEKKEDKEDWRFPGAVLAGELSDAARPPALEPVLEGLTKHHGYCRVARGGGDAALTASEEGVFELVPPDGPGGAWATRNVLPRPVSDIAVADLDGDGVDEMAAIEPFHGDTFAVYKSHGDGYRPIYRSEPEPFCHAIQGGRLRGEAVFVGGDRAGERELFVLRLRDGGLVREVVEGGGGPSNVLVLPGEERDLLVAANRERGEGAVFFVTDD
jgi:hypothetical protein